MNGFEAAVVFQGFATGVAKTAEVGVQRVFALAEAFIQRLQQPLLGFGGGGPVDQARSSRCLQLVGQAGGIDGGAHRTLAEDRPGRAVQAVEKQTAGRRIRAVAPGVVG